MGVRLLHSSANRHTGRVGADILIRIGLEELVLENEQKYVSKATELSLDLNKLCILRDEMRNRMEMSLLCDAEAFARDMEVVYRRLWRNQRTGGGETAKPE